MEELNEGYCFPEKFALRGEAFFKEYVFELGFAVPDLKPENLKDKAVRRCRFCGRGEPDTTFKNEAHLLPELLGRHNLISDFECDQCNKYFKSFEDHLSNYLGFGRTLLSILGKEKVPKFKSVDKKMQMESKRDSDGNINVEVERFSGDDLSFEFDETQDLVTVTAKKHTYIPGIVYKSFLKMALSSLAERDLIDYRETFRYLRNGFPLSVTGGFMVVNKYTMAYTFCYERPAVLLFRKRNPTAKLFTHMFVLFAINNIYQLALPLNTKDRWFYGQKMDFPLIPPIFGGGGYSFPYETIVPFVEDFSSIEQRKREEESFRFKVPLAQYKIPAHTNPDTGEFILEHFDPKMIKSIIFQGRYPLE